jgi:hypothetical protein
MPKRGGGPQGPPLTKSRRNAVSQACSGASEYRCIREGPADGQCEACFELAARLGGFITGGRRLITNQI